MDFTIIIPAKNEEKNIDKCLHSINAMTYDMGLLEVLVIDNGSSDRTIDIARANGAKVFEKPDVTISGLRNFGFSMSEGTILAFLDADCTVAPDWLIEASRYLNNDEVACFGSPPTIPTDATWVQKAWFKIRAKNTCVQETEWLESMNMFVPRHVFASIGGFNEKLVTCEDYDLSLRLKRFGKIISDSRIVAVHHGEATDLRHFFRKEHWRGSSNFRGVLSHGLKWRELPSLMIPTAYVLLMIVVFGYLLIGEVSDVSFALFMGLWQVPLALFAAIKTRKSLNLKTILQLIVLLNVYFLARGLAVLRLK